MLVWIISLQFALMKKIHQTTNFEGVSGIISIDETGNATRSVMLKEIKNQKQVFKDIINP